VLVSPVGNADISGAHATAALAFVNDPSRRQRPAEDILRTPFGLTPAEYRVLLFRGDGRSPKEIAGLIGVSVETVRSQMNGIFSKTDVKRQSELVRLFLSNSAYLMPEPAKRQGLPMACGGGSSGPPPPVSQTYTVTVTATSGALQHMTVITVTVN